MTAAMIDRISLFQREFGRRLISAPLVADGLNNDERKAVEGALSYIAGRDIELALLLLASSWVADGISPEERYSMEIIDRISAIDGELGKLVVESQWVADGISPEERYSMETIDRISAIDGELGKLVVEFQWVADGLNEDEMKAFTGALSYIAERDIELAMLLLASSWVADGISPEERYTLETIDHISGNDGQIAKELVASQWIADGVDSSETYVLDALLRVSEHPDSYSQLTSQPWFIDGLDDEEAVFVIALGGAASRSLKLFEDLLTAHYIQHSTISLSLAGEVNIWVIENSPPPPPNEDVLTLIEDHVRISEEFMEVPFPVADVILLHVDPHVGDYGLGGGWHSGSHFVAVRPISGGLGPVPHEMAHYYFNFRPRWLVEGGANFIAFYIVDDYEDWRSPLLCNSYCLNDSGIENLRHFSYWEATPGIDRRVRGCVYNFGENFLVRLLRTIGREAMSSALRELHLSHSELSQAVSEEDVYQAFLNHTPSLREEQFVDLYRNLHGGAFAFPDTDFSDEHSDSAEGASPVSVGGAAEGSLDYMFDFDFFWFRAEKGQRYRVHVEHETLRSSNVNLYAPDSKTLVARNWQSRSSTPYGPQKRQALTGATSRFRTSVDRQANTRSPFPRLTR